LCGGQKKVGRGLAVVDLAGADDGVEGVLEFEAAGLAGKHCWLEIHAAQSHR